MITYTQTHTTLDEAALHRLLEETVCHLNMVVTEAHHLSELLDEAFPIR